MVKNKILIINSNYYPEISDNLLKGVKLVLKKHKKKFYHVVVPGAFEIPVILNKYKKDFIGFIILGCVIRGETSHFDVVKDLVFKSIYETVNSNLIPLGSALLTVNNFAQALERSQVSERNLGGNAANVCLKMMELIEIKDEEK